MGGYGTQRTQPTVAQSIFDLVGNTPLLELTISETPSSVSIYGKLEGFNPSGSIKDRIAKQMIETAEQSGELTPNQTIIEPTSGNTGIAVATAANAKGYDCRIVMSGNMSIERVYILKALGADVVITPPEMGEDGALHKARELVEDNPDSYWMPGQFSNEQNRRAHYETTGPEIWDATEGSITHFVAGMGTAGTISGVGRYLQERDPSVEIIAVHPTHEDEIQGLKNVYNTESPENFEESVPDEVICVDRDDADRWAKKVAQEEGLFLGQSSGCTMYQAAQIANDIDEGTIVAMFADMGFKYLTTGPYHDERVEEQMNACRTEGSVVDI